MTRLSTFYRLSLMVLGLSGVLLFLGAEARSDRTYVHPEFLHSYPSFQMPGRMNLNQASLPELMVLPGVDEDIALKLIRFRKQTRLECLEDFHQIPHLTTKDADRLGHQLASYVSFLKAVKNTTATEGGRSLK